MADALRITPEDEEFNSEGDIFVPYAQGFTDGGGLEEIFRP